MTKIFPSFVPSASAVLLIGCVAAAVVSVDNSRRDASERALVAPALAQVAHPVRETRTPADSERQIEGMSEDAENALVNRTDFYWHRGDYPRIIALDRVVTEVDPQDVDTYSTGGWLMESDGDNADAEAYYSLGLARNPSSSYAAYSLATFYYNTVHQYSKAESVLSRSVHDADAGVLDWKMLAHTYERENRYADAVATWKRIQHDYPTTPALMTNLNRDEAMLAKQTEAASPPSSNASAATVQPSDHGTPEQTAPSAH